MEGTPNKNINYLWIGLAILALGGFYYFVVMPLWNDKGEAAKEEKKAEPTKEKEKPAKYGLAQLSEGKQLEIQQYINKWRKAKGLKAITEDGVIGDKTRAALVQMGINSEDYTEVISELKAVTDKPLSAKEQMAQNKPIPNFELYKAEKDTALTSLSKPAKKMAQAIMNDWDKNSKISFPIDVDGSVGKDTRTKAKMMTGKENPTLKEIATKVYNGGGMMPLEVSLGMLKI